MDCRKPVALAFSLLAGAAGCSHQAGTVPTAATPAAVSKADAPDPEALKRQPKPETFVAFGDFSAREAAAATDPAEQEARRDRARRAYQEAIKTDPSFVPAYKALARLYSVTNDLARAKETGEAAVKLAPNDAGACFDLGMIYARAKEWEPAVANLARASELDPENRSYCRYLGFTLARAGQYDECIAAFSRYEGEAKAHYFLAEMLEHVGQAELCKSHLQMALAKDPQFADAARMMARLTNPAAAEATAQAPAPASGIQTVGYTMEARPAAEPTAPRLLPPPPAVPKELPPPPPASASK